MVALWPWRTPICGGFPDYWGVFKEYDFTSLTGQAGQRWLLEDLKRRAQGAYDPRRYIWYSLARARR